jgi:hypothetical protein
MERGLDGQAFHASYGLRGRVVMLARIEEQEYYEQEDEAAYCGSGWECVDIN